MYKLEKTFESIGNLFTSVAAIIFVMTMIILSRISPLNVSYTNRLTLL